MNGWKVSLTFSSKHVPAVGSDLELVSVRNPFIIVFYSLAAD